MKLQMIDGAIVISMDQAGAVTGLAPADFKDKELKIETEPAFYVALGATGLLERSVSVTTADRKTVAALVGNWIAEGYQPVPCDIKAFSKHVRNLAAANKPAVVKTEGAPVDGSDASAAGAGAGGSTGTPGEI